MMDGHVTSLYGAVEKLLAGTMGLDPGSIGAGDIKESARAQMKELGIQNIAVLLDLLRSDNAELQKLIERVVVPETWFFRDRESFAFLSHHLRRAGRPRNGMLRILSVPCSTGEEPYSIAITLLESGLTPEKFHIDAADISRAAIAAAKRAAYGKGSFREKNMPSIDRYFTESESVIDDPAVSSRVSRTTSGSESLSGEAPPALLVEGVLNPGNCQRSKAEEGSPRSKLRGIHKLKLDERVTACVAFHQCNFVRPDALADQEPYDIIFCKNLLIYLNPQGRASVAANLDRLLVPGGLLFTGHAEVVSVLQFGYTPVRHARSFACIKGREERVQAPDVVAVTRTGSGTEAARKAAAAEVNVPVDAGAHHPAYTKKQPRAAGLDAIKDLADKGALDRALPLCEKFLELHPRDKDAYCLMGLIKLALNAFAEAEGFFQKALYLDPQHYDTLVHMGLLYEKKGDSAKASLIRGRIKRIEETGGNRQETA